MLQHDEVLTLYVGLSVSLLLTFLLFVPEKRERSDDWTERRGEVVSVLSCVLVPDVRVLRAAGRTTVYSRPRGLNSPSVMSEPPPVPGKVVQLPDSQNTKSDSMLNKNLRLLGRVFVVLV